MGAIKFFARGSARSEYLTQQIGDACGGVGAGAPLRSCVAAWGPVAQPRSHAATIRMHHEFHRWYSPSLGRDTGYGPQLRRTRIGGVM